MRPLLERWWQPQSVNAELPFVRWLVLALWVFIASVTLQHIDVGSFLRATSNAGILLMLSCYLVGPQCWSIVDAAEGSNSRKALTILVLFGFLASVSATIAYYAPK